MKNTDIRTLKIFEFNRALSYVSEIIEIKRKIPKLQQEIEMIKLEENDWSREEPEDKKDLEDIQQIIEIVEEKIKEIEYEQENLQKYLNELQQLVSSILEYVVGDADLELKGEEIQKDFLEEYVYLLSEPVLDYDFITIEGLFENKTDLAILIFESYGREKEHLLRDIVITESTEYLPNCFEDYFPQ